MIAPGRAMPLTPEEAARRARRALLKQQTELIGDEVAWLFDPGQVPSSALGVATASGDLPSLCFSLATWFLIEVVRAAERVQQRLSVEQTLDRYAVTHEQRLRVIRAVLQPTSRHAPGIFAMAEIVAAVPVVASRQGLARTDWGDIARRSKQLAAKLSCDGSDMQVIIRRYLRGASHGAELSSPPSFDPTLLMVSQGVGLTSVTPIDDLVKAAKAAVARHIQPAKGLCVAMLAKAPSGGDSEEPATMYDAIWTAYVRAAERLVFPMVEISRMDSRPPREADPDLPDVFDGLALQRAQELKRGDPAKPWQAAADASKMIVDRCAGHPQTATQTRLIEDVETLFGANRGQGYAS